MVLTEKEEEKMSLTEHTEITESKRWLYFFHSVKKIKPTSFSACPAEVPNVSTSRRRGVPSVDSSDPDSSERSGERACPAIAPMERRGVRTTPNSGIVLIMVLGLLALMIIMAVTFAVSMRTERLAAGNYADNVRARELVHVGLARAMNDLANNLGTSGLASSTGGKVYPDWNVTNSHYTNISISEAGVARWVTNIYLMHGEATNYVPRALWTDATNADLTNPSNHWLPVEHLVYTDNGINLVESNLMGRVAYLILNCSGLLDANYAGGGGTRGVGTNLSEIVIVDLGEIGGKLNSFLTARGNDVRFETLAHLNANGDFFTPATNFFVYSHALPGYWNTNFPPCVGTQVNLSGSAADLMARRVEITNAFCRAGFDEFRSGVLYSNLIDYVDSDSIPSNFEYCVESVPMINEIAVSVNIKVTDTGPVLTPYIYEIGGAITNECWYPFVVDSGQSFKLCSRVTFATTLGAIPELPDDSPGQLITPITVGGFPKNNRQFGPITIFSASIVDPVEINCTVYLRVELDGDVVDRLNVPIVLTIRPRGALGSNPSYSTNSECLDPRFNYDPGNVLQWQCVSPDDSLGIDPNEGVENKRLAGYFGSGNDGDGAMFVSNGPLRSVAELGYLVYSPSEPWKTVKLYDSGCHRVLDVFGLSTNTANVLVTNETYRGRVNCNSNAALDATAAVFAGMPVDNYPGEGGGELSMTPDARDFASKIFNGGIFTNLSDIGRAINSGDFPAAADTELKKEAFFRNSINLLNLRQNVFTIIIEAQAASRGNIPRNPAKQRAVAIVWRDPFTGEMFVRHIKWLGD